MGASYGKNSDGNSRFLRNFGIMFFFAILLAIVFGILSYHFQKNSLYSYFDSKLNELAHNAKKTCGGKISQKDFLKTLSAKYNLRNIGQATIHNGKLIHECGNCSFIQERIGLETCEKACCQMKNQFCTLEDSTGEWRVILIPAVCKDKQKRVFAAAASLAPLSGKMDESIISILSTSALVFICAMGFLHIANKMHFRFAEELISDKNETESRNENYSGTLFDAMERRISHLEFELNDAKTEAAAKSLFLSNAAHELKTPLSPIVGFADMLAKERLDSVHLRMVKQIRQNAFRELELVEDILEYARLDSGRIKLEAKEVNIKNELESCISQMKTYHPGAKIFLDVDKDLDKFKIDPNRFRQIILKLLSNAIKFMPVDGETHVSAAIQEDPEREKNLIVSVHDNGIGIAESDFDKIFQPFGKIDSTKAKSFEGIGLGLVTAKRLAELHGGRIDLESQPGKGSKFIVNLPSKEA